MAKLVLDKEIESLETPWDGAEGAYPGKRVEEFIKKQFKGKAGYLARTAEKEADGNYHCADLLPRRAITNGTAIRKRLRQTSCSTLPCQAVTDRVRLRATS